MIYQPFLNKRNQEMLFQEHKFDKLKNSNIVNFVHNDHPKDPNIVVVVDCWLLKGKFMFQGLFGTP